MKDARKKQTRWMAPLLAVALVLTVAPLAALAGGPPTGFTASGTYSIPDVETAPWTIDAGDVTPAGGSGRFVVKGRTVEGFLSSGDITGPFSFTFGTNVPLTQSGQIHATFAAGSYEAKVHATSQLVQAPGLAMGVTGFEQYAIPNTGGLVLVAGLGVTGTFAFTDGAQGQGAINAQFTAVLHPTTRHIVGIAPTGHPVLSLDLTSFLPPTLTHVTLAGQWHQ